MSEFRMIAIASDLANKVRETKLAPGMGIRLRRRWLRRMGLAGIVCDRSWWGRM